MHEHNIIFFLFSAEYFQSSIVTIIFWTFDLGTNKAQEFKYNASTY